MRPAVARASWRRVACALAVAAALAVAGVVGAGAGSARAASSSESLLINANADGDTPISGGAVRVYPCVRGEGQRAVATGAPLRQSGGARVERTNSAGVALLDFDRLPRCFVVRASGGEVNGRRVRGSLRAQSGNRSGRIADVLVTPVSTLIYSEQHANAGMSRAGATRLVEHLLGIPAYFDAIDLDADDTPFDGDTYMAAAVRAGGIERLNRSLLRTAHGHGRRAFRAQNARTAGVANDLNTWWKDTDVTALVTSGLKDFGLSILGDATKSAGKWVLGRLLDEWGLKDVKDFLLPKSDTERLIDMVQELTKRVNNLQKTSDDILKEVLGANYHVTVSPTLTLLSRIKTIQQSIEDLLKLKDDDPGRVGATKRILGEIKQLEPDRNLLNDLLTQTGPGGDGILRAASKKAALKNRWFTPEDSRSVREVYDYYAIYQLRLANLLTEYWNTRSCTNTPVPQDCLSPTTIQLDLDKFQTAIQEQQALLKPPLPAGTFIDRGTMRMWPRSSWPLNGQQALDLTSVWQPRRCVDTTRTRTCKGSAADPFPLPRRTNLSLPALGPWTDWQTPTEDDFKSLIDGWEGDSPLAWLHRNAGFRTTTMNQQNDKDRLSGHMWFRESMRPGTLGLYVYRINISEPERPGPHVWYKRASMPLARLQCSGNVCTEAPSAIDFGDIRTNYTAEMVLWRPVNAGDYWWQ